MNDLMIRDDAMQIVSFAQRAEEKRGEALVACAGVLAVTDAETNAVATQAQLQCHELIQAVRKAGKTLRQPLTDFSKKIIKAEDEFVQKLEAERERIARLIGNFQQAELARQKAALAAQTIGLTAIEQQRQSELAQCETLEQRDQVEADYNLRAQQLAENITAPVRASGQVVKQEWEIVVNDVHALYRAHPNCCKVTPLLNEIKMLLDMGITVRGITANKVTKASVRAVKAIDV